MRLYGLQKLISDLPPIPRLPHDMESRRADDFVPIFEDRVGCFSFLWLHFWLLLSNGAAYLEFADGVIVGTSVKRDGKVSNPVDSNRVAALRKAIQ